MTTVYKYWVLENVAEQWWFVLLAYIFFIVPASVYILHDVTDSRWRPICVTRGWYYIYTCLNVVISVLAVTYMTAQVLAEDFKEAASTAVIMILNVYATAKIIRGYLINGMHFTLGRTFHLHRPDGSRYPWAGKLAGQNCSSFMDDDIPGSGPRLRWLVLISRCVWWYLRSGAVYLCPFVHRQYLYLADLRPFAVIVSGWAWRCFGQQPEATPAPTVAEALLNSGPAMEMPEDLMNVGWLAEALDKGTAVLVALAHGDEFHKAGEKHKRAGRPQPHPDDEGLTALRSFQMYTAYQHMLRRDKDLYPLQEVDNADKVRLPYVPNYGNSDSMEFVLGRFSEMIWSLQLMMTMTLGEKTLRTRDRYLSLQVRRGFLLAYDANMVNGRYLRAVSRAAAHSLLSTLMAQTCLRWMSSVCIALRALLDAVIWLLSCGRRRQRRRGLLGRTWFPPMAFATALLTHATVGTGTRRSEDRDPLLLEMFHACGLSSPRQRQSTLGDRRYSLSLPMALSYQALERKKEDTMAFLSTPLPSVQELLDVDEQDSQQDSGRRKPVPVFVAAYMASIVSVLVFAALTPSGQADSLDEMPMDYIYSEDGENRLAMVGMLDFYAQLACMRRLCLLDPWASTDAAMNERPNLDAPDPFKLLGAAAELVVKVGTFIMLRLKTNSAVTWKLALSEAVGEYVESQPEENFTGEAQQGAEHILRVFVEHVASDLVHGRVSAQVRNGREHIGVQTAICFSAMLCACQATAGWSWQHRIDDPLIGETTDIAVSAQLNRLRRASMIPGNADGTSVAAWCIDGVHVMTALHQAVYCARQHLHRRHSEGGQPNERLQYDGGRWGVMLDFNRDLQELPLVLRAGAKLTTDVSFGGTARFVHEVFPEAAAEWLHIWGRAKSPEDDVKTIYKSCNLKISTELLHAYQTLIEIHNQDDVSPTNSHSSAVTFFHMQDFKAVIAPSTALLDSPTE